MKFLLRYQGSTPVGGQKLNPEKFELILMRLCSGSYNLLQLIIYKFMKIYEKIKIIFHNDLHFKNARKNYLLDVQIRLGF